MKSNPRRPKPSLPSPHTGGDTIPPAVQEATKTRILAYAQSRYHGRYSKIEVWFRNQFCYIDAYREPSKSAKFELRSRGVRGEDFANELRATPIHLCRLRYFATLNQWSVAYFSHLQRYEPSIFLTGKPFGTPDQGFDLGARGHL